MTQVPSPPLPAARALQPPAAKTPAAAGGEAETRTGLTHAVTPQALPPASTGTGLCKQSSAAPRAARPRSSAVDRFLQPGGVTQQPHRMLSLDDLSRGKYGSGGPPLQWSSARPSTVLRSHISGARIVGQVCCTHAPAAARSVQCTHRRYIQAYVGLHTSVVYAAEMKRYMCALLGVRA